MNIANQTLAAIKNRKALLTKEKDEAIQYITNAYNKDMAELEKEEKELLKTFHDIPIEDIYPEEE